jgi:2-polyprenyl-3-methyl-5-hydroxy-6-metoxy-1,4-benzoquinol methylase
MNIDSIDYNSPIISDNRNFRKEITAIDKHFEEIKKESSRFPKVNGIIADSQLVDDVKFCPICNSASSEQLFLKYGFLYVRCFFCKHVFVKNRIRESYLLNLYSESNIDKFDREVQKSKQHQEYWGRVYNKYLSFLSTCQIKNNNLLDIGCGYGGFLSFCKNNSSYDLHAIDFSDDTYNDIISLIGKEKYYFKQKIEDIDFKNKKFGIITFWGVMEHLSFPRAVISKCHDALDTNGHMLILIPNLFSRAFRILGINVPTLNAYQHIQFFSPKSFSYLCNDVGFGIVKSFQELPIIDLMYDYVDYNSILIEDILRHNEAYYHVYVIKKE